VYIRYHLLPLYSCVVAQDVLADDHIKLDENFKNSFIGEIIKVGNRINQSIVFISGNEAHNRHTRYMIYKLQI